MDINELRESDFNVTSKNVKEIAENILLVSAYEYMDALGIVDESGWSEDIVTGFTVDESEASYDEKGLRDIQFKVNCDISDALIDKSELMGIIEEDGSFKVLPIVYSYESGEYEYLPDFICERADLPDEDIGQIAPSSSYYYDSNFGNYLPTDYEETTVNVDWDVNTEPEELLAEMLNKVFEKGIKATPELAEQLVQNSEKHLKEQTEGYRRYMEYKAKQPFEWSFEEYAKNKSKTAIEH